MANEARITNSLNIVVGNLNYQSRPTSFTADVSVGKGPTPGLISASLTGTDVDLSLLDRPGLCWIQNLDTTNRVEVGVYEPSTGTYYPLLELLAAECYPLRLSRNLREQFAGTVTGTGTDTTNNTLRIKAYGAACSVRVEAFES